MMSPNESLCKYQPKIRWFERTLRWLNAEIWVLKKVYIYITRYEDRNCRLDIAVPRNKKGTIQFASEHPCITSQPPPPSNWSGGGSCSKHIWNFVYIRHICRSFWRGGEMKTCTPRHSRHRSELLPQLDCEFLTRDTAWIIRVCHAINERCCRPKRSYSVILRRLYNMYDCKCRCRCRCRCRWLAAFQVLLHRHYKGQCDSHRNLLLSKMIPVKKFRESMPMLLTSFDTHDNLMRAKLQ